MDDPRLPEMTAGGYDPREEVAPTEGGVCKLKAFDMLS
jgi:hypothetical protein